MKVCIAEKPSVARDIAAILKADKRCDGYYEGNGYYVTWVFGHLCELKEPHDYLDNWKRWSLASLPLIPDRFGIKLKNDAGVKRQFKIIEKLCFDADEVINCGDAGQEGELIQRWVMQKAGVKCPVKRLWISSLTDEAIRKGFEELKPESEYDSLYHAGLSRAIGDWVLGINATRLYTMKYASGRGNILSVGRVQTPTLAMVVERQRAIENFKPETYYELHTVYRDTDFSAAKGKYDNPQEAQAVLDTIKNSEFVISATTDKPGREAPPRLFDLTSLQVECNRRWGWTADKTLKLIQTLYEKKVTTYPRVDTTYLPDDMYPKIAPILRQMSPYANLTLPVLASKLPKSKKVFNNAKVTDHHAIIPTGQSPSVLAGDEKLLYHIIALRFIAAFYPDCKFTATTVTGIANNVEFKATGKVITDAGWRVLFSGDKFANADDSADAAKSVLPEFKVGEKGPHKPKLAEKHTQPPKLYTEGTLLRAMETAGKNIDDEELREAMKENGIGRPSTRAAIIETLFSRKYIQRQRKNIVATPAGIALVDTICDDLLKSPKLTGLWEKRLRQIEHGSSDAATFVADIKQMIAQIVDTVICDNSTQRIVIQTPQVNNSVNDKNKTKTSSKLKTDKSTTKLNNAKRVKSARQKETKQLAQINLKNTICPSCGKGYIVKGRTAFGCSCYGRGCNLLVPFSDCAPQTPIDAVVAHIIQTSAKLQSN